MLGGTGKEGLFSDDLGVGAVGRLGVAGRLIGALTGRAAVLGGELAWVGVGFVGRVGGAG